VIIDDKWTAYSKLAKGTFPDFAAVANEVAAYAATGKVPSTWAPLQ
jgi:hypothetical protein